MKILIIPAVLFVLGCVVALLGGADGTIESENWITRSGMVLCILGIGWIPLSGGVISLYKKIKGK